MSPHKAYIVGVGQPSLDDLLRVVIGQEVALDPAAAQRIKKDSPPPKAFETEPRPAENNELRSECLDQAQTRVTLFVKLVTLINGKSRCRLGVVETLIALLNSGIMPCLPVARHDAVTLKALANAMLGVGLATWNAAVGPIAEAFQAESISPPGLSSAERAVLEDGQIASAGTGAICVLSGRQMILTATAIAALSAEALQAEVKAFDPDTVESLPHKGAVEVSDNLRALLDGSKQVNRKKEGIGAFQPLLDVPVVHGAALHDITAATGPVKSILSSGALPAGPEGAPQQASSPALPSALMALAASFLRCASLSLKRTFAMIHRLEKVGKGDQGTKEAVGVGLRGVVNASELAFESVQQQVQHALCTTVISTDHLPAALMASEAAYAALRSLQQSLESEALAAVVFLRLQEGLPAPAKVEAITGNGFPAAEDKTGGKGRKGEDKAGAGMVLGRGTAMLRKSLETTAAAAVAAFGMGSTTSSSSDPLAAQLLSLSLTEESSSSLAAQLRAASIEFNRQLDPAGPALAQHMAALSSVLEANAARRKPKIAKGARDFAPDQMAIREVAFNKIIAVFKRHGAVAIDTPVFELRETLMGKYGEDSKLIYDLADQGGELLSLRYDLTVPFARYVALNGIINIKRYHIAKVYRRDQPQMNRGRFREFFQCDFDVAGVYPTMVPDAEVLKVLVEILDDLDLGDYEVKLNHRRLLDAMLDIAGVPPQKFRAICSAIDKLDKESWEDVRTEMTEEKGLPGPVADRIGEFVVLRGAPRKLLAKLTEATHALACHPDSAAALAELGILFDFLDNMGGLDRIVFDLSLARGLDYYTGVIYEAVLKGANVGSIAAGGRYDKLVGMFSGKEVPAVGVSIGIERVFAIMEAQLRAAAAAANGTIRETETQILIASAGSGLQQKRMQVASLLWAAGVKAEFGFKPNPKMADQLGYALKGGIPFIVLFGEDELAKGVVKLKDLDAGTEEIIPENELADIAVRRAAEKGDRRVVYAAMKEPEA